MPTSLAYHHGALLAVQKGASVVDSIESHHSWSKTKAYYLDVLDDLWVLWIA